MFSLVKSIENRWEELNTEGISVCPQKRAVL